MKNKRTYYRDAKGRFSSKPNDSSNFLRYMTVCAINYFRNKRGAEEIDFEHLINDPKMQGKDYTDPNNNEMIY